MRSPLHSGARACCRALLAQSVFQQAGSCAGTTFSGSGLCLTTAGTAISRGGRQCWRVGYPWTHPCKRARACTSRLSRQATYGGCAARATAAAACASSSQARSPMVSAEPRVIAAGSLPTAQPAGVPRRQRRAKAVHSSDRASTALARRAPPAKTSEKLHNAVVKEPGASISSK